MTGLELAINLLRMVGTPAISVSFLRLLVIQHQTDHLRGRKWHLKYEVGDFYICVYIYT
jgi:hypothetical protein